MDKKQILKIILTLISETPSYALTVIKGLTPLVILAIFIIVAKIEDKPLIFIWILATIGAIFRIIGFDPYIMRLRKANPGKVIIVR